MTNLTEFGNDFPISNGIKSVLDRCKSYKPVVRFVRTLLAVCYVYDDNSILILPLRLLQTSKACREIAEYISNPQSKTYTGILFTKYSGKIREVSSLPGDIPKFMVILESGDAYTYVFPIDSDPVTSTKRFNLAGLIESCKIYYPYIVCYIKESEKCIVYAATLLNENLKWSKQCITAEINPFVVQAPSIYIIKEDGLYGCALDETGQRIFPRELTKVFDGKGLVPIRMTKGLFLYYPETSEILKIEGKKITRSKLNEKACDAQILFAIGPVLIGLCQKSIIEFDFVSGQLKYEKEVAETKNWILSLESSYGAVMFGSVSYSLANSSVPPLINLFASPKEIKDQLMHAKTATGTVATPIILMANRSPYLAATLMKDELKAELSITPAPGSMQEFLRPALQKINALLQNKPE